MHMQSNHRALIISDAKAFLKAYSALLEENGYELVVVRDLNTWYEKAETFHCDIYFIDNRDRQFDFERFLKKLSVCSAHSIVINVSDDHSIQSSGSNYLFNLRFGESHVDFAALIRTLSEYIRRSKNRIEFGAMLIHDIRSPLNSLIAYIELLLNQTFGPLNEGQLNFLEKAMNLGDQTLDMLEDINEIYRTEQYTFSLDRETFSINKVLDESLLNIWIQADQRNIKIRKSIPGKLPLLSGDPYQIQRVFVNLLGNAIKYCPDNSTVIIKADQSSDRYARFSIVDNGGGIPEADLDKIFSKAFRVESNQHKRTGEGLGLYICKLIVKAHGGAISAENNDIGGVSFNFTLPLATSQ